MRESLKIAFSNRQTEVVHEWGGISPLSWLITAKSHNKNYRYCLNLYIFVIVISNCVVLYCIWTLVIAPLLDFPFRGGPDYCANAESEFYAEAHEQLRVKDLLWVPTRLLWGGFEPATIQLQGTEQTPTPPSPRCNVLCCIVFCIGRLTISQLKYAPWSTLPDVSLASRLKNFHVLSRSNLLNISKNPWSNSRRFLKKWRNFEYARIALK